MALTDEPNPKATTREARQPKPGTSTLARIASYTLVRAVGMVLTVLASLLLIIYIANLGGYLDIIQQGLIDQQIAFQIQSGWLKEVQLVDRPPFIERERRAMEDFYGLHEPLLSRSLNWLYRGLTFDWGTSRYFYPVYIKIDQGVVTDDYYDNDIKAIIFSTLPRTLLLIGLSNLGLFACSILFALPLTRSPGSFFNRVVMALTPLSSAPSWFYGIIFTAILYQFWGTSSLGPNTQKWASNLSLPNLLTIVRILALPFAAIIISKLFQNLYAWRNYFLVYSQENYLELAKAKGLPEPDIERRYLVRPALPGIITSFALIVIMIWQECIALEYILGFNGIGQLFVFSLTGNDFSVIIALVATFAYFLGITVFVLDILYALVDPRVRVGDRSASAQPAGQRKTVLHNLRHFLAKIFHRRARGFIQTEQAISRQTPSKYMDKQRKPVSLNALAFAAVQKATDAGHSLRRLWLMLSRFPSSLVGLGIIALLGIMSTYTMIQFPYEKVTQYWDRDLRYFYRNPIEVPPVWVNWFRKDKLPESINVSSITQPQFKKISPYEDGMRTVQISLPFRYDYGVPPQDVLVLFYTKNAAKQPFVRMKWVNPDGRQTSLKNFSVSAETSYLLSADEELERKLKTSNTVWELFSGNDENSVQESVPGDYELRVEGILFDAASDLDVEMVVQGKVFGLAGTDRYRKDLFLALGWGTMIALLFGITAALGTTFFSVTLAAAGAWFGGWVDWLIQRISEINMVLPVLPTAILIFYLYSKSFWVLLGITIALSIFGIALKNYRAMFLQVMETPYIEAARSYGTPNLRMIFRYLIPRIQAVLIPQVINLIPSYVFFEATLAFLGVSDPFLPTLGKLLYANMDKSVLNRPLYLSLEPVLTLLLIGVSFSLLGYALEHALNEQQAGS